MPNAPDETEVAAYNEEMVVALDAGRRAAEVILDFYDRKSGETYTKRDGSPVTDADLASDRVIRAVIGTAFPEDALLTEEGASSLERTANPRCWIVDPIDGTAQFVARTDLFDVMIALAVYGQPVVGVSVRPVSGIIHAAVAGHGAWEYEGTARRPFTISGEPEPPRLVSSRWYGGREKGEALARIAERLSAAGILVKEVGFQTRNFADSERGFDGFVGLPPNSNVSIAQEWDLAAADVIVHEAGGAFTDCWGRRHRYNKRSTGISGGIVASTSPLLHQRMIAAIAPEIPVDPPLPDPADDRHRHESVRG
jgi:3'-phosphoadenosine 5'-phosphosulfate (PAPS) 3'-phosphatase